MVAKLLDARYAFHQSLQEKDVALGARLQLPFHVGIVIREPLAAPR